MRSSASARRCRRATCCARWIGPPFRQTFPSVLGDDEARIVAAIDHYRDRFEDDRLVRARGLRRHPGADRRRSSAAGDTLAVVTTKPESQARLHRRSFSVRRRVRARLRAGRSARASRESRDDRARRSTDFGARAEHTTMIGDRHFDIEGARANDVRAARRRLGIRQHRGIARGRRAMRSRRARRGSRACSHDARVRAELIYAELIRAELSSA